SEYTGTSAGHTGSANCNCCDGIQFCQFPKRVSVCRPNLRCGKYTSQCSQKCAGHIDKHQCLSGIDTCQSSRIGIIASCLNVPSQNRLFQNKINNYNRKHNGNQLNRE